MNKPLNAVNLLIGINLVLFFLPPLLNLQLDDLLSLHYPAHTDFAFWQPLTYLFIHGSAAHILFNMFALFAFGSTLEKVWGARRFLIFYFVSGLGAALVYTLVNAIQYQSIAAELTALGLNQEAIQAILDSGKVEHSILIQMGELRLQEFYGLYNAQAVGASGAIYGILIAFAIMYPQTKLFLLFLPIPIAAKYFVPLLIAADFFFGATSYSIGNIAHFAHIGGAAFGLLMMLWWRYRAKNYSKGFD